MKLDPDILAPRENDDIRRKLQWILDQLKLRSSSRGFLEHGGVDGGVVTLPEILRDPLGSLRFKYTDTATATGPGDLAVTLTYVPIDESVHVYWNGIYQPPNTWAYVEGILTLGDPDGYLEADDEVWVSYAHKGVTPVYPDPPSPPEINFIGVSSQGNALTTIALPAGTELGDAFFLYSVASGTNGYTDPRIVAHAINGAGAVVAYGYEDGSGDPIAVTPTGSDCYTEVMVLRGVVVTDFEITQLTTNPFVLPVSGLTPTTGYAAVGINTNYATSGVSNVDPDSTAAWVERSQGADNNAGGQMNTFESVTEVAIPAGSFNHNASSGGTQTVFLLGTA